MAWSGEESGAYRGEWHGVERRGGHIGESGMEWRGEWGMEGRAGGGGKWKWEWNEQCPLSHAWGQMEIGPRLTTDGSS